MSDKTDDLIRKIRALKAKAEDPSVTEAEASAFAAKVAQLLAQHGLEEAALKVEEQTGIEHITDHLKKWTTSPARQALALALCRLYMVKPILPARKGMPWSLIGRRHNIVVVQDMMDYLTRTTIRLSNEYKRSGLGRDHIDFRRGCFVRLVERVTEMHHAQARAAQPAYTPQGNPGNLPALYAQERTLLNQYAAQRWRLTSAKQRGVRYGTDGSAGYTGGGDISLSAQVGAAARGAGRLLGGR